MWLTVSEDPHGRIRYHQDHFPRGTYRPPRRVPSPSSPETIYSSYPPPPLDRYSSATVVDLEREEYDNVNPDSPIPQYYYGYSCSPGTSSSSNYDEEYNVPTASSKRDQCSSTENGGSRRNSEYGTTGRSYHDSNGYNTRKTIYWDPKEFSYTLGTSGRFSSRRSPAFNESTNNYGTYRSREHTIPIFVESGPKKYDYGRRDSSPRELDSEEFDSRIHALKDHYRDPKELNFMPSKTEYRDPKEFSSMRSSKSVYGDPKEFLSNDLDFLKDYEEDPIYRSAISEYQAFPKREPMVPSPDYSPPPPVNRVRFVDDEQAAEKKDHTRNGYSTYCQRQHQQPKNNNIPPPFDSRGRSADSARTKKNDYQRRLQTSASDADLSRYATASKRRSVPYSESKGLTLKQARRFIKERIFSSVAAREPRSTLPQASSVFSSAPPPPAPAITASPFTNGVTPVGTIAHTEKTPVSSGTSSFFRKKKKDKKPRIRKEDISNPTNFQHKAHVGWDQDSGFSNNVDSDPMDESIKNIIRAAGQDPNNLSKKTIKFVYDFIERYEENTSTDHNTTAQFSRHQAPPPPVPISQPISQWAAPPPPPPSRGASYGSTAPPSRPPPPPPGGPGVVRAIHARPLPQVPPSAPETRPAAVPPPPPPPSLSTIAPVVGGPSVPPAPPPPPPLSSTAPAAPPPPPSLSSSVPPPPPPSSLSAVPAPQSGRGDLLAQIQAGKQLRSVTTNAEKKAATSSGTDARGDVMAQIRLGSNLKHVDHAALEQEKRKSAPTLADMGGIAGALAKALEERRMNMCIDDSSDDDESDEKNEWSD